MSIHEQITALLDGELADAGAVAELMHVLAVSPEKRELLVEQLSLKRQYMSSASKVVPPTAADLSIMQGLGAIDAGFGGASRSENKQDDAPTDLAPAPVPVGLPATIFGLSRFAAGAAAVLLSLGAFGAGYAVRGDAAATDKAASSAVSTPTTPGQTTKTTAHASTTSIRDGAARASTSSVGDDAALASTSSMRDDAALAVARDSIALLSRSVAGLTNQLASAQRASARLASRRIVERVYVERPAGSTDNTTQLGSDSRIALLDSIGDGASSTHSSHIVAMTHLLPPAQQTPRAARVYVPTNAQSTTPTLDALTAADDATPLGIQLGLRTHFRVSLPRVYGLSPAPTALLDREIIGSYELGNGSGGALSRIRAGAAFGQTQFAMVFHSNTGGEPVDTIFEQSPHAFYGRAFIAPELIRSDAFAGLLEVGGGYSQAGGFGTVGLNVELRPTPSVAVHAGASTWLLWTKFHEAVNLSTNVNAHVGVMIGF